MKRLQGDRSRKVSFFQEKQTKNNKHFYNISFFFDIAASSGSNKIENYFVNLIVQTFDILIFDFFIKRSHILEYLLQLESKGLRQIRSS